jgi:hypothetical protein
VLGHQCRRACLVHPGQRLQPAGGWAGDFRGGATAHRIVLSEGGFEKMC